MKRIMRNVGIATLALFGFGAINVWAATPREAQPLCLTHVWEGGNSPLTVAIADEPREIRTGLMFREDLAQDEGMLFTLNRDEEVSFWMKNTPLPLDLVFIDRELEVIRIRQGEPYSVDLIDSEGASPFVLELNAGAAERLGIVPGLKVGPFTPLEVPPACRD